MWNFTLSKGVSDAQESLGPLASGQYRTDKGGQENDHLGGFKPDLAPDSKEEEYFHDRDEDEDRE